MAATNAVERITIEGDSIGFDKVVTDLKKTEQATDGLAQAANEAADTTEKSRRRMISAEQAYARVSRQLNQEMAAQAREQRNARVIEEAFRQNIITMPQRDASLSANASRFNPAVRAEAEAAREAASARAADAAAAARLRAELDPLTAAQSRLNAEVAEYSRLASAGHISTQELSKATATANDRFNVTAARLGVANDNIKLTSGQMQNLSYQTNDLLTMWAMGASPFQIISSQAGQVYQALGDGPGGVRGSLRAIGDAAKVGAMSVASALGPVGLALAGLTVAATAFIGVAMVRMKPIEQVLEEQEKSIRDLATAYGVAADAAENYGRRSKAAAQNAGEVNRDDSLEALRRDTAVRLQDFAFAENRTRTGDMMPVFAELRAAMDALRASAASGVPDVRSFEDALVEISKTGATAEIREFARQQAALLDPLTKAQAGLSAQNSLLSASARASKEASGNLKQLRGEMAGFLPEAQSQAEQIRTLYFEQVGQIGKMAGSPRAMEGLLRRTNADYSAAIAELARGPIAEAEAAANRLANLSLAPDARTLAELRQSYDVQIAEMERVNGAAEAVDAKRRERDAAVAAATIEITRAEDARRANADLDLQAVTARTAAEKALIAEQRVRIDLVSQGYSAEEAAARAAEVGALSLAESRHQLSEATRQQSEATTRQIEQAQLEYDLVGKSAGEVARLRAEFQMLAQAKDAAAASGFDASTVTLTESMREQAAEIGRLTEATQRLNMERDQTEQMRMLQAEAGLIGMNDNARRVALAGIEAEAELRREGIDLNGAWGRSYVENAQTIAATENVLDDQREAFESLRDAASGFFQELGSGKGVLESLLGAFGKFGQQNAAAGFEKLFGLLSGGTGAGANRTADSIGSLAGAIGQLGQRSSSAPAYGGSVGQTYAAPLGAVTSSPLPAINVRAVSALNDNLQRSSRSALDVAKQFSGLNERADSKVLDSFLQASGTWKGMSAKDFAWCASFANAALIESGQRGTGSNMASSFMNWGAGTNAPKPGDIVVFRPQAAGTSGHVSFFEGFDERGNVRAFGGNQSGAARTSTYGIDQVRSFRTSSMEQRDLARGVEQGVIGAQRRIATGSVSGVNPATGFSTSGMESGYDTGGRSSSGSSGLFGARGQAGFQVLGAGLGAFGQGYESGSPFSGGLSGAFGGYQAGGAISGLLGIGAGAGAALGIVGGAALGIIGGILGARKKREQEHQQKAQAWADMQPQWQAYQTSLDGAGPRSGLRAYQDQKMAEFSKFQQVAGEAWKRGTGNSSEHFNEVGLKLFNEHLPRGRQRFAASFEPARQDMLAGRGLEGPFIQAQEAIIAAGEKLLTWVDDADFVFGETSEQATQAREAARAQAMATLDIIKPMSQIETEVATFEGAASSLKGVLVELGMTADEASVAIDGKLAAAMERLGSDLTQSLTDSINEMDGKGYLADFRSLIEDNAQMMKDISQNGLNVDTSLVDTFFTKSAQAIVDGAQLTGEAFDALIVAFPQLAGVVKAFVDDVAEAEQTLAETRAMLADRVDRAAADVTSAQNALRSAYEREKGEIDAVIDRHKRYQETIRDFLTDMRLDSAKSVLDPTQRLAEARKLFDETAAKAMAGDEEAQGKLVDVSQRYLDESLSFHASTEKYHDSFEHVRKTLEQSDIKAGLQITASQRELDALTKQVSSLISIDTGVQSVANAIKDLNTAIKALAAAQGDLDANRDYGANTTRNKAIVEALRGAGVDYTGGFGGGQFDTWFRSLSTVEQARLRPIIDGTAPAAQNYGAAPTRNQSIVSGLAGAGLNYTGGFGNGQFAAWVNSLPEAQRAQANAIAGSYSHIGYANGGYTGSGGMYDVAGLVHRGEVVWSQRDVARWGGAGAVDAMRTMRLPQMAQPVMPQMRAPANDSRSSNQDMGALAMSIARSAQMQTEALSKKLDEVADELRKTRASERAQSTNPRTKRANG